MIGQFHFFLLCASCGILGGLLYDIIYCLVFPFGRVVHIVGDILFCVLFSGVYILFSTYFGLPPMRFYLIAGLCVGFFLYSKSLHKMVDFFARKVYNSLGKKLKSIKEKLIKKKSLKKYKRGKQRKWQIRAIFLKKKQGESQ